MSNERTMWNQLRRSLKGKLLIQRLESHGTSSGIPDLVFADGSKIGFIELKYLHTWPKRKSTPVKIRTFTPFQRNFLSKWGEWSCGMTLLMIKVGRKEFLVFDSFKDIGNLTESEMKESAFLYFENGFRAEEFIKKLWEK